VSSENHVVAVVNSNEGLLPKAAMDSVSSYGLELQLDVRLNRSVTWSDHYPFWVAGYPSMLLVEELDEHHEFPENPYYHTPEDTWDKLSESQMENATRALAGGVLKVTQPQPREGFSMWTVLGLVILGAIIIMWLYIRIRKAGSR
jgi:hypothetical protein